MRRSERASAHDLESVVARSARFRLEGQFGRGASGVVFDVFDRKNAQRVALKISHIPDGRGPLSSTRWLESHVKTPRSNLVRVFETGLLEGHPFYTMERIEGRDLVRALRSRADDRERSGLRDAFVQLTRALNALHEDGCVHRDVKPANVIMTYEGRVVVLDLDLIVTCGEASASSSAVGTPAYMSPEQAAGGLLSPASDLYAVGVMLYEALSGGLPYAAPADKQAAANLQHRPLPLSVDIPADLARLCHQLLEPVADLRPSAYAVLQTLGVAAADNELTPTISKESTWVGRSRELAILWRAWQRAGTRGTWLHIQGPAGRGKSELVKRFLSELSRKEPQVQQLSVCFEGHARGPYGALEDLIQALVIRAELLPKQGAYEPCLDEMFPCVRRLTRGKTATPTEGPLDPHEHRERAELSLRALLLAIAGCGPVLVWLDDTHHAPGDASRVVQHWMRFPSPPGVLLITCGEEPAWARVRHGDVEHLALEPLAQHETLALCAETVRVLSIVGDAPLSQLAEISVGEPWSALEVCRAFRATGVVTFATAEEALLSRVGRLPPRAREVLELIAVAQRRVSYEELVAAARVHESQVASALHVLSGAALVHFDVEARSIDAHPRVATVVREALDEVRAADHYESWMLVSHGQSSPSVFSRSYYADRGRKVEALHAAAWEAARLARRQLAFAHAAELAQRAHLAQPSADSHTQRELAELLALAGRNLEAAAAYERAGEQGSPLDRVEVARLRARLLLRQGEIQPALAAAHEVLASVGLKLPTSTGHVIASLLWNKALLSLSGQTFRPLPKNKIPAAELARVDALWSMGTLVATTDAMLGVELTTRCTRLALRCGDPERAARALLNEALNDVVSEKAPFPRARKRLQQADALVSGIRDPALHAYVRMAQGVVSFFIGEPTCALEHLDAADAMFATYTQHDLHQLTTRQFGVQILFMLAQAGAARERTERFVQQSEARGDLHAVTTLTAVGVVPSLLCTEDDPEAAREALTRAMSIWPRDQVYLQHLNELIAEMMILEYSRRPGMVASIDARVAELAHAPVFRAPPVRAVIDCFRVYGCLVEAAHARGDERKRWTTITRRENEKLANSPIGFARRRALQITPQVLLVEGRRDEARLATERAREDFQRSGHDVTWTEYILGRLEGGSEGRARVEAARVRMQEGGYRNIERALAMGGGDLVDGGEL